MRLLFDQHLSDRLPKLPADLYPGSLHVNQVGVSATRDEEVWRVAAEHGCLLVTKDEDFHRLSILKGAPPKVIWIRLGNCTTEDVTQLLRQRHEEVQRFAEHEEANFLSPG